MKLFFRALCCAVIISCLFSLTGFCTACGDIEDKVFRLHILANSDSTEDQALKLKVRDTVTEYAEELFADCKDKADAMHIAEKNIDKIRTAAENTLKQNGSNAPVTVSITKMSFDTRVYEDFTLPAGKYDALRIVIGEGKGHNWWCVLYPAVCVPSAQNDIGSVLSDKENEIVSDSDRYRFGFKFVELFQDFLSLF